jgi:hypothetical protein
VSRRVIVTVPAFTEVHKLRRQLMRTPLTSRRST